MLISLCLVDVFLLCRLLQQEDLQDGKTFGGVPSRNTEVGLVVIRDVSVMMPIHQSLAQTYT